MYILRGYHIYLIIWDIHFLLLATDMRNIEQIKIIHESYLSKLEYLQILFYLKLKIYSSHKHNVTMWTPSPDNVDPQ